MNNKLKIVLIILAMIITVFPLYITIDCIRLRNAKLGTKPLITIKEEIINEEHKQAVKYTGIGYTIKYLNDVYTPNDVDIVIISGYGAEFRLFDKILIWAWVE